MRILFVADGRSPTALSWMEYFTKSKKHEVHLVSTFPTKPPLRLASLHMIPVAFSTAVEKESVAGRGLRRLLPSGTRTWLRNWLAPGTLGAATQRLQEVLAEVKPELVHAMRIPFEGMLAAAANPTGPLLISVWGNDFTLHAHSNPRMAAATLRAMRRADALHTDTERDKRLAGEWGFEADKPTIVLPGNGGVRTEIFYPARKASADLRVINPRGLRAYLRNDTFFRAIPLVLEQTPSVQFDCPAMQGEPEIQRWVERLGIGGAVNLLPKLSAQEMAAAYRGAQVMVSPSTHDGTPNSLLEAMACGAFPVCGNLESIREWIRDGENGLLVDPNNPGALAAGILRALGSEDLRQRAGKQNAELIAERAEYASGMHQVETFYASLA